MTDSQLVTSHGLPAEREQPFGRCASFGNWSARPSDVEDRLLQRLMTMLFTTLFVVSLLSSCGLTKPGRQAPADLEIPEDWKAVGIGHQGVVPEMGWLQTFDDPEMERLVTEAVERNRDIRVAAIRLRAAKERTIFSRAARLPVISTSGSASHTEVRSDDGTGGLGPWRDFENYDLSLNLSWEVDLWGRLRNLDRAGQEDYIAEEADFRAARFSLAANTARAWCNLIAARRQVDLARQTRDIFLRNFRITERNYKAGDPAASALDVQFGRNQVASAERGLIARERARDEARRSLELLLGRYPAAEIEGRDDLPELASSVPAGIPSDLLMRRPDLVAAAADLRASAERADAARKNLLPAIRLSASGSTSSDELADLVSNPLSIAWNVAAALSQPIIEGGTLLAQARIALLQNEASIESFAAIALRAFREVESALAVDRFLAAEAIFLETELVQANLAETQSMRDYSEGLVGVLSLLEAQRRAFNARSSEILLSNERLQNRIDLHLALGGDFGALPPSELDDPAADPAEETASLGPNPR